jgi:hypothetical protein
MFQDLKILSPQTDASTRYTNASDWAFAAELTAIPVTRDEYAALAQEYAIVFSNTAPSYPMAVLGLDGKNCYINAAAQWTAQHLPSRLAIYPFGSALIAGKTELVRYASTSHFDSASGKALYDEQGKPTELMEEIITMAARNHLGLSGVAALTQQLDDAGLLLAMHLDIGLPDGSQHAVNGFLAVDEAALAALDPERRAALEASGAMALLNAHKQSLSNFARLLTAADTPAAKPKKASKPRAAAAKPKVAKAT